MEKSTPAAAASLIRAELKVAFPGIVFQVRSDNKGGSSVRVSWIDGPVTEAVAAITGKYEMGHFDGMVDCYEYSNRRSDIPQVKFCFENREMSKAIEVAIKENICQKFGIAELNNKTAQEHFNAYPEQVIYRAFAEVDFSVCNAAGFPCAAAGALLAARDEAELARYATPAAPAAVETPAEAAIAKARAERIEAEQAEELKAYQAETEKTERALDKMAKLFADFGRAETAAELKIYQELTY